MDKDKLRQRLLTIFLGEFDRYLEILNSDLAGLQNDPDGPSRGERIERLHRDSHGLKGAARSAGMPGLQRAFLGLERLMAGVGDGQRALDSEVFQLLASAAEALAQARAALGTNDGINGAPLDQLVHRLETATGTPL